MTRPFALMRAAVAALLLLWAASAGADSPDQIRHEVARILLHHVVYVHHSYEGSYLHYDEDGRVLNHVPEGAWSDTGVVYPTKVELNGAGLLHIEAERVAMWFDHRKGAWATSRRENMPVVVEVQFAPAKLTLEVARRAISVVFAMRLQDLAPDLPGYWQPCTAGKVARDPASHNRMFCFERDVAPDMHTHAPVATTVPREADGMHPARAIESPAPRFTEAAREFDFNGTSILWAVVGEDGRTKEMYVVSPVGYGLDDEALHALQRWRFSPATLNGRPIASQVTVEVNFKGPPYRPFRRRR